jgi:hypothetical protein
MLVNYEMRQLRQEYNCARLKELGLEMAAKQHFGLSVDGKRLSVDSLGFLENFRHLKAIEVRNITKGMQILATMPELQSIALCELSTKEVSFLKTLPMLQEVWVQAVRLGRWESLGNLKQVKAITLFSLRQDDFGFLADMEGLQFIHFNWCSRLTMFPSLSRLKNLRRVVLETVNRLTDISGIVEAPNLEELIIGGADALTPEAFECTSGHPSLKAILPGIAPMNTTRWADAVRRIPDNLLMKGYYGTDNEHFHLI